MSWWYWHKRTQSVVLVLPPWRLCLTWWTSQWAGRRWQPPGQAQPLSRAMTALRMASGMVSAYPTSRIALLVLRGLPRRLRRRAEARAPGPETNRMARRARAYCRASQASGVSGCGPGGGRGLRLPAWGGRAGAGLGVAVGVGDQGDHLGDEVPVGGAGDDRDDHRVARDRLGVLPRQVPVLAGPGAEPGVLDGRRAVHPEEVGRGMVTSTRVGPGPVGDHLGADEELAGFLEGVVVALLGGAEVLRPAGFAEGVDDGGEGGGALGGQVAPEVPGVVEGGVEDEVAVAEPAPGRVVLRVGLLRPPRLVRGLGQQLQVVQVRARLRCLDQDPVGLGLELVVVDAAGPGGDLPRPRDRHRPAGGRLVQERVPAQQAHLPDGGLRVLAAEAGPWRRARRRWWRSRRRRGRRRRRTGASARWPRRRAGR